MIRTGWKVNLEYYVLKYLGWKIRLKLLKFKMLWSRKKEGMVTIHQHKLFEFCRLYFPVDCGLEYTIKKIIQDYALDSPEKRNDIIITD